MRCRKARKLLALYVGADLDPRKQAEVSAHVRSCLGCARILKGYRRALGALRSLAHSEDFPGGDEGRLLVGRDEARRFSRALAAIPPPGSACLGAGARREDRERPSLWASIAGRIEAEGIEPRKPTALLLRGQVLRLIAAGTILAVSVGALGWRVLGGETAARRPVVPVPSVDQGGPESIEPATRLGPAPGSSATAELLRTRSGGRRWSIRLLDLRAGPNNNF